MAVQTIGTCRCGAWASLTDGLCPACRLVANLTREARGGVVSVPIARVRSGLPLKVRCLASAGFSAERIAGLLGVGEADVRAALGER